MKRLFHFPIFLLLLCAQPLFYGCGKRQRFTDEQSEQAWWDLALRPSWIKFEEDKGPGPRMYADIDSLQRLAGPPTPLSRTRRFDAMAIHHFYHTRDYAAALRSIDSALLNFRTEKAQHRYPRTYLGLLLFAGDLAYRTGQYDRVNELYFRAKRVSDERLPLCERSVYTYNVAMLLYKQQQYEQSARYFREAFNGQEQCADQTTARALQQQEILSNIGLSNLHLRRLDTALFWFDRALTYAEAHRDSLGQRSMDKIRGVIVANKAKVFLARNDLAAAEPLLREGIALNARPGYEVFFAQDVRLDLATLYARSRRYAEMDREMAALRADLDTLPNPVVDKEWYGLMATHSRYQNDVSGELRYFKQYKRLSDSLENVQRRQLGADLLRRLREKELQLQVTLLEQDRRRNTIYLVLLGGGIVLAGLLMWVIARNNRRNQRNLAEVTALNQHIREQQQALELETARRQQLVMEAVIAAQESERSAIGLELHDNINQVLTTVKLHNEMVLDGIGDPKAVLQRSTLYLQQCINEIRALSKRLSAPTLGKISLCDSVAELVQSINLTGKLTIRNECTAVPVAGVRREVHLAIYRIIQEALNNILKHSGASEADLSLRLREDGSLLLDLSDNGQGYRPGKVDGIGITNMRTRAESLGGSFRIGQALPHGCRVEVVIPGAVNEVVPTTKTGASVDRRP
ncbi:sensor histidine kinase [Flaviaesturariibacter flavus]|uniref:Sensor histidine kinase n=1 Tax=Flaviaesturariibacter flavus TaxID=2502780 RepID=A0A4R1BBA7_9BACT|nr:sensor histidine kinase [Flaviaesturariibacter flavus]TCJ14237.1 sensor histidine kinase [Flaviaesturariibacter flavus]